MPVLSDLHNLLSSRPIVLWVEDRLTKEYLSRLWMGARRDFQIMVAGGHQAVSAVVHDQRDQGYDHVYGFIDRDFGIPNHENWSNPSSGLQVFISSRLETENFLLDWPALAGCRQNESRFRRAEGELQQRARSYAEEMIWWMACRRVISDYRVRITGDFLEHPRNIQAIQNQADAERYIRSQEWFNSFSAHSDHIQNPKSLNSDLSVAGTHHRKELDNGEWIHNFSGKEIFRSLRGYIFNQSYASDEEMDVDLAKSVADWQVRNDAIPPELLDLRDALRQRVGI